MKYKFYLIYVLPLLILSCDKIKREVFYYENGQIHYEVPIVNGKREGKLEQYFENGKVQLTSQWISGIKHGPITSYYKNGVIKSVEYASKGMAEGRFLYYDSLGNLIEVSNYSNNQEDGEYFKLFPDSTLNIKASYKEGEKDGKVEIYDKSGVVKKRMIYELGELMYSVEYTRDSAFFNPFLSINVKPSKDSDSNNWFDITLEHSFYDSARVGVILGHLNQGKLIDTLKVLGTAVGDLTATYKPMNEFEQSFFSGILFEILLIENGQKIMSQYPFEYHSPLGVESPLGRN